MKSKIIISIATFSLCFLGVFLLGEKNAEAEELPIDVSISTGESGSVLTDVNISSKAKLNTNDSVTLTASKPMDSIYIKWDKDPGKWTLEINGKDYTKGGSSILHEFVELPEATTSLTIKVQNDDCRICDVWGFNGDTPDFVQKWEAPLEKADLLVLVAHADDEALFFGPAMINYVDKAAVQVAMFTNFHDSEPIRTHEFYNSLWHMGIKNAPIIGPFYDYYSETLETAESQYTNDASVAYVTELIRRFKPQVVTTHDVNGEYGHGCHMLCAHALKQAIELSADETKYPESAQKWGGWAPLKTYIHLLSDNQITLDTRTPLENFGGKTAIEIAREAYKLHESQQWCWFYVEDGIDEPAYQYSCAKFGLYNSSVGEDVNKNDLLENITSYAEQERLSAEKETSVDQNDATVTNKDNNAEKINIIPIIIIIIIVIVIILILLIRAYNIKQRAKRRARRREARNRDTSPKQAKRFR